MSDSETMQGGCLCGAVRYEVTGEPFDADWCHCRMCQKHTGAVAGTWMDYRVEQLRWTAGAPAEYASSGPVCRGFCATCGSTLSYRDTRYPDYYSLAIASLDEPGRVPPRYHIHTASRVSWLEVVDDCPRFPGSRGEGGAG